MEYLLYKHEDEACIFFTQFSIHLLRKIRLKNTEVFTYRITCIKLYSSMYTQELHFTPDNIIRTATVLSSTTSTPLLHWLSINRYKFATNLRETRHGNRDHLQKQKRQWSNNWNQHIEHTQIFMDIVETKGTSVNVEIL